MARDPRVLLLVVAGMAVLVRLAVVVRASLPGAGRAGQARVKSSPQAVWDVITDHRSEVNWRPGVRTVEPFVDRDGMEIAGAWTKLNEFGRYSMIVKTIEEEPPRRLVWQVLSGRLRSDARDFQGGSWTIELEPAAEGTLIRIREDGDVHQNNTVLGLLARFVADDPLTVPTYLKALRRRLAEKARQP